MIKAYCKLGMIAMAEGSIDKAIQEYQTALDIDNNSVEAKAGIAQAMLRAGKIEESINLYQNVQAMDPESASLNYHMGTAYAAGQRYEQALDAFSKTIEINPEYAEAYLAIGNTLNTIGKQETAKKFLQTFQRLNVYKEELSQAESLVRLHPRVAEVHYNMATALAQ